MNDKANYPAVIRKQGNDRNLVVLMVGITIMVINQTVNR